MCRASQELQGWKPQFEPGDVEWRPDIDDGEPYVICDRCDRVGTVINFVGFDGTWLPRQSQLEVLLAKELAVQEEHLEHNLIVYSEIESWISDLTGDSHCYLSYELFKYKDMPSTMLAYWMHLKFKKRWTGKKWKKERWGKKV